MDSLATWIMEKESEYALKRERARRNMQALEARIATLENEIEVLDETLYQLQESRPMRCH